VPSAIVLVTAALMGPASGARGQVERLAPADTAWTFTGEGGVQVRGGEDVIYLRSGQALRPDVSFSDGTIEFDLLPTDQRTFLGVLFRRGDGDHTEDIYFRLHKSGLPDAIQYTPDYRGYGQWQLYHGPGTTAAATFPAGHWRRVRIEVRGERAAVFIGGTSQPQLVVDWLRAGTREGHIGFWGNFPGASADDPPVALLRDVTVRHGETTYTFPFSERTAVPGIISEWGVSRPFAREGDVVREPPAAVVEDEWATAVTEPSGLLPLDRDMPRPDEGVATVLAGLRIDADSDRVARLDLGFSDDASVFLNGRLLYAGKYGFSHNFPRRQGLITLDQAALYLPLERGANELVVAVSEVYGGWGIMGPHRGSGGTDDRAPARRSGGRRDRKLRAARPDSTALIVICPRVRFDQRFPCSWAICAMARSGELVRLERLARLRHPVERDVRHPVAPSFRREPERPTIQVEPIVLQDHTRVQLEDSHVTCGTHEERAGRRSDSGRRPTGR
jgi:hypothetical protein